MKSWSLGGFYRQIVKKSRALVSKAWATPTKNNKNKKTNNLQIKRGEAGDAYRGPY